MRPLTFKNRRRISLGVTALLVALVWLIAWIQEARLAHASVFTGSTVLGSLVLLALLGVRRRIPVLHLGSVSTWTQIHIYTGLFAAGVYVIHVPAIIAGGVFECGLSIMFVLVSISGVYGVYASRTLPRRLTAVGESYRFDRVDWHRSQIARSAEELLEELKEQSGVHVLGRFYHSFLAPFFHSRPTMAYVLAPNGVRRQRLISGLTELDRYLEADSRSTAGRLAALVRRRDDLDYQFALQLRLRTWLVVHSVFSVILIVGAALHAITALRFLA
jgi:hypothetical protein